MAPVHVTMKQPPPPTVIVKKGLSFHAATRWFGYGTLFGTTAGFIGGFVLAQSIYSDQKERDQVKRTVKVTAYACGGAVALGVLGTLLARLK